MRTSLHKIEAIEKYLHRKGSVTDRLLMDAHLQLNQELAHDVSAQQQVYSLVHQYGREKVRHEICLAEEKLFKEKKFSHFQAKIWSIFKK